MIPIKTEFLKRSYSLKSESTGFLSRRLETQALKGQRAAGLEQALEARHDGRPAMTCRLEGCSLRFEVVMGQSELDHRARRLKFGEVWWVDMPPPGDAQPCS